MSQRLDPIPDRPCLIDLALAGLAILVAVGLGIPFLAYTADDAFITFRYGQHLSAGFGPVFNAGERVEGYTSFAWMLLMAAALALQLDPIVVSKILGLLSTLATGALVFWAAGAGWPRPRRVAFIAVFLLVSNAEVAASSTSGLESTFFMAWITAAIACALREARRSSAPWSSLLFGVAALTRPEGLAFFALHLLFLALVSREKPARLLARLGLFLLVVLPHWAWRMAYYGQPLPATYYAKLAPLTYRLASGGFYVLPFLLLFAAVVVAARLLRQPLPPYLLWMSAGGIAIAWWEGGDWMIGHRFLLPVVPAWSLLAGGTLSALHDRLARGPTTGRHLAFGLIVAALVVMNAGQALRFRHYAAVRAEGYEGAHLALARWLDGRYDAGTTIALMDVGLIGYYSNLRVLDITGLTDITIARAPGSIMDKVYDPGYVLDQEPAAVVLISRDDDLAPDFAVDRRLYDDPRFQAAYKLDHTLEHYRDSWMGTYVLLVFVRRTESGRSSQP